MKAYKLLARLNHLVLAGQNEDGELEWIGTDKQWDKVVQEDMNGIEALFISEADAETNDPDTQKYV